LIALTFVVAVLLGGLWASGIEIASQAPAYQPAFESFLHEAKHELSVKGVDTHSRVTLADIRGAFAWMAENFKDSIILLGVMLSYVILAVPEAARWKTKLKNCFGKEKSEKILSTTMELSEAFQAYIAAVVIGGLINAALITGLAYLLGL